MGLNVSRDEIKSYIAEYLNREASQLAEDAHLIDDLGLDSLDSIEMVMFLEEKIGHEIPDDYVDHIKTVGDLIVDEIPDDNVDHIKTVGDLIDAVMRSTK